MSSLKAGSQSLQTLLFPPPQVHLHFSTVSLQFSSGELEVLSGTPALWWTLNIKFCLFRSVMLKIHFDF